MSLFRILILFFLLSSFTTTNKRLDEQIKKISYCDRKKIEFFFKDFYLHDLMGHIIFFDTKPMSMITYNIKKNRRLKYCIYTLIESVMDWRLKQGWLAWKRNEHLFPHPNYIFAADEVCYDDGERVSHIFAINKRALIKCLQKNESLFQEKLGSSFSVEQFISDVEKRGAVLSLINHDECLLGILFGYGAQSSLAFQNRSLGKPYEELQGNLIPRSEDCPVFPIGFMGVRGSDEVQNLAKIYTAELNEIVERYLKSKDFLSLVLNQITQSE